jgi:hypothetical protein
VTAAVDGQDIPTTATTRRSKPTRADMATATLTAAVVTDWSSAALLGPNGKRRWRWFSWVVEAGKLDGVPDSRVTPGRPSVRRRCREVAAVPALDVVTVEVAARVSGETRGRLCVLRRR